ncbi:MAG: 50S ribosomal protein L15 [Planctomycetes bacterium]|nr:50S ribosomal protein L15 [Planctomycetota bacterium]
MMIHQLNAGPKARARKRVGRGIGSGHGKTSGRGHKGAGSRSGYKSRITFEGGQMPLVRRIAKRGFNNNAFATEWEVCDVADLEKAFNAGETVTVAELRARGVLPRRKAGSSSVKLLGAAALTKSLTVVVDGCTVGARKSVELAGGKVVTQGRVE